MHLDWSTCQCCGQPARQYRIATPSPGWPYSYKLVDLCDGCSADLCQRFSDSNQLYAELLRRATAFKRDYEITGFIPIIMPKPSALVYEI